MEAEGMEADGMEAEGMGAEGKEAGGVDKAARLPENGPGIKEIPARGRKRLLSASLPPTESRPMDRSKEVPDDDFRSEEEDGRGRGRQPEERTNEWREEEEEGGGQRRVPSLERDLYMG